MYIYSKIFILSIIFIKSIIRLLLKNKETKVLDDKFSSFHKPGICSWCCGSCHSQGELLWQLGGLRWRWRCGQQPGGRASVLAFKIGYFFTYSSSFLLWTFSPHISLYSIFLLWTPYPLFLYCINTWVDNFVKCKYWNQEGQSKLNFMIIPCMSIKLQCFPFHPFFRYFSHYILDKDG